VENTRRKFLAQGAGALGLLFLDSLTPQLIAQASQHARAATAAANANTFRFLTAQEAADFDAFAAQVIPSTDGTPGAREAGVVYFADYVLTTINPEQQKDFRGALAALHAATLKAQPGATSFASLSSEQQIAIMKAMEKPPTGAAASNGIAAESGVGGKDVEAFGGLRGMVLVGTFCDPSLHGNRFKIGWNLIDFDDQAYWAPPFGYYDAHQEEKA
jgi:gluconate 2-dehydrogenase gamma chain